MPRPGSHVRFEPGQPCSRHCVSRQCSEAWLPPADRLETSARGSAGPRVPVEPVGQRVPLSLSLVLDLLAAVVRAIAGAVFAACVARGDSSLRLRSNWEL